MAGRGMAPAPHGSGGPADPRAVSISQHEVGEGSMGLGDHRA